MNTAVTIDRLLFIVNRLRRVAREQGETAAEEAYINAELLAVAVALNPDHPAYCHHACNEICGECGHICSKHTNKCHEGACFCVAFEEPA